MTAQRREESLSKTGVALSVVTGTQISNAAITQPSQLNAMVPALSVTSAGGANSIFFVRGVGNFTVNAYSDPATAFNYDGVYIGRPTSTSGVFYDLERVEVLKGPQGTLYGRNATAGAINIIPTAPRLREFGGYVTGSYGNYDAYSVQGAVNIPIGEDGAIRVAGNVVGHDGYLSDGTSDEKSSAFRFQMLAKPTPDLTIRVGADYSHSGGMGTGATYLGKYTYTGATGGYSFTPSGFSLSEGMFDPAQQAYRQTLYSGLSGRTLMALDTLPRLDNSFFGANAVIDYATPAGTITFEPAFRDSKLDNMFTSNGGMNWIQEKDQQTSLELRFASERVGIFDFILGGYYFHESIRGNYSFDLTVLQGFQDFETSTDSYAGFLRATAHLGDRLRLIGGVRYTKDSKDFNGQAHALNVICRVTVAGRPSCPTVPLLPLADNPSQLPAPFVYPAPNTAMPIGTSGAILFNATTAIDQTLKADRVTFRAGAEFDLTPTSLLYASFENGYRSGGFALAAGHETYEPEYIDAYTIGMKNRFFNNRVQLNLEGFYWKYRNQQVSHQGVDTNGNTGFFTENVGRSTIKGFEAELTAKATPTTMVGAIVQYTDGKFKDFSYTVPVQNTPPYVGCPYALNPANSAQYVIDCSGMPAFTSPKWTVNLKGQQTIPLGDYKIVASADTQYRSGSWVSFEYIIRQPSYWRTNAELSFGSQDDRWNIAAFVRNIENGRQVSYAPAFAPASAYMAVATPPRTYGVRANMKF